MAEDYGTILFEEAEDGSTQLNIDIEGTKYVGKKNERKTGEKHPDYRIFKGDEEVGAAWKGVTSNDRQKLSIKLTDGTYLTAVLRDQRDEGGADMTIMPPRQ